MPNCARHQGGERSSEGAGRSDLLGVRTHDTKIAESGRAAAKSTGGYMSAPVLDLWQHEAVHRPHAILWTALVATLGCGGGQSPTTTSSAAAPATDPPPSASTNAVNDGEVDPDGPGKLPMSEVDAHMDEVRQFIRACAEATTYEGKVSVRVTITPQGAASAVVESASGEPDIDQCMIDAFTKVTFPASERGQRFAYSYTF